MKQSIFFSFVLISILLAQKASGQNCQSDGKFDWTKVVVKEMESRDIPEGVVVTGESIVKIKKTINSVGDLSAKELKKIKKKAAQYGSCLVYIDAKGFMDSSSFPTMASQNKLYYYWVKEK